MRKRGRTIESWAETLFGQERYSGLRNRIDENDFTDAMTWDMNEMNARERYPNDGNHFELGLLGLKSGRDIISG